MKYGNWIAGILAAAAFACAVAAINDMQTAEGVGLYFFLKLEGDHLIYDLVVNAAGDRLLNDLPDDAAGAFLPSDMAVDAAGARLPYDLAVDAAGALGLLLLTALPCLFLRHRSASCYFRILIAFLAFMPMLSMAYLLHPLAAEETFSLRYFLPALQMTAPFMCLLAAALSLDGAGAVRKRWYGVCCLAAVLLLLAAFCVPSLQQLLFFVLTYLLLLICFDLWERLFLQYPALNRWGGLLFGGLGLRALYVLLTVMSKY